MRTLAVGAIALICTTPCAPAHAWGDKGHKVVALIADHYLQPAVRQKVNTILAGDTTGLTPTTGIADEATWADRFRDSDRNTTQERYLLTRQWHFVNVDINVENSDAACFGHPAPPPKASSGPAQSCIIDRVKAFAAELGNPGTTAAERRAALQFLLHFVGDLHQPLHASDDHDKGGNDKKVQAVGLPTNNLHQYWDTQFILRLGSDPAQVATRLVNTTTPGQISDWSKGDAATWARQSYELSKLRAYGPLGQPGPNDVYQLSTSYVTNATNAAGRQLARAGVRLAKILNEALGSTS